MSDLLPDEELPRRLDAAELDLATGQHRWFAIATLLAALASGITLLLPWTFSRRLGLSVWELGIEAQPSLVFLWLAGLITSSLALILRVGPKAQAVTSITAVVALIYGAGGWQANTQESLSDTWPGPGPAFAIVLGLSWLLAATAQLIADRPQPSSPSPEALKSAIARLRGNRPSNTRAPIEPGDRHTTSKVPGRD